CPCAAYAVMGHAREQTLARRAAAGTPTQVWDCKLGTMTIHPEGGAIAPPSLLDARRSRASAPTGRRTLASLASVFASAPRLTTRDSACEPAGAPPVRDTTPPGQSSRLAGAPTATPYPNNVRNPLDCSSGVRRPLA